MINTTEIKQDDIDFINIQKGNVQKSWLVFALCCVTAFVTVISIILIPERLNEAVKTILTFISGAFISLAANALYFLLNYKLIIKEEKDLRGNIKDLTENIRASNEIREHFKSCENVRLKIFNDEKEFYEYLEYARERAETRILLTNFSTKPYKPDKEDLKEIEKKTDEKAREIDEKTDQEINEEIDYESITVDKMEEIKEDIKKMYRYFKEEIAYCNKNKNIQVKRIITIHSRTKLYAYKKMIKEAVAKGTKNLHIAYLDIDKFELSTTKLPTVIGIQIIDNEVIIMDPRVARISNDEREAMPILLHSEKIADIFGEYHKALWNEIKKSSDETNKTNNKIKRSPYHKKHGCILYEWSDDEETLINATTDTWKKIKQRVNTIEKQMKRKNKNTM